eukprot:ctg_1172.g373
MRVCAISRRRVQAIAKGDAVWGGAAPTRGTFQRQEAPAVCLTTRCRRRCAYRRGGARCGVFSRRRSGSHAGAGWSDGGDDGGCRAAHAAASARPGWRCGCARGSSSFVASGAGLAGSRLCEHGGDTVAVRVVGGEHVHRARVGACDVDRIRGHLLSERHCMDFGGAVYCEAAAVDYRAPLGGHDAAAGTDERAAAAGPRHRRVSARVGALLRGGRHGVGGAGVQCDHRRYPGGGAEHAVPVVAAEHRDAPSVRVPFLSDVARDPHHLVPVPAVLAHPAAPHGVRGEQGVVRGDRAVAVLVDAGVSEAELLESAAEKVHRPSRGRQHPPRGAFTGDAREVSLTAVRGGRSGCGVASQVGGSAAATDGL